jgi:excisionase family DNA binding protein
MFIHLHEPEQKPCDNCGNSQTILFLSALRAERTINLCKDCAGEAIPAFAMVARKIGLGEPAASTDKGLKLLTLKELADLLSVHECTIYRQLKAGRIPFVRLGGEYRFNPSLVIEKLTAETNRASLATSPRRKKRRAESARTLHLVPARTAPSAEQEVDAAFAAGADASASPHRISDGSAA